MLPANFTASPSRQAEIANCCFSFPLFFLLILNFFIKSVNFCKREFAKKTKVTHSRTFSVTERNYANTVEKWKFFSGRNKQSCTIEDPMSFGVKINDFPGNCDLRESGAMHRIKANLRKSYQILWISKNAAKCCKMRLCSLS